MINRALVSILLAALTIVCFAGCGTGTESSKASQKPDEAQAIEAQKPEIEAAITYDGNVLAWCLAYDVKELIGAEPFRADRIPDTMPVYKNRYVSDGAGVPLHPADPDLMMQTGKDLAKALDLPIMDRGFYVTTDGHLNIQCDQVGIQIDPDETVFIQFGEKYPLPIKLEHNQDYLDALNYAVKELKPLLAYWHMENPEMEITHEYTFSGEKNDSCYLVDQEGSKGSLEVVFLDGYLSSVIMRADLLTKEELLGEYPTISYDEAKTQLLKGQYLSFVPLESPIEESQIEGAVIGYKIQCYDEVLLPFYAFYVDITDCQEAATPEETRTLGLRDYTTYLVPAIKAEYLDEFPEIKVYFN